MTIHLFDEYTSDVQLLKKIKDETHQTTYEVNYFAKHAFSVGPINTTVDSYPSLNDYNISVWQIKAIFSVTLVKVGTHQTTV